MKGRINTGVDQTELLFESLQLFQSHFHTLRHNKVIKNSWRILWIFQDLPKSHEDVSKLVFKVVHFMHFFRSLFSIYCTNKMHSVKDI